VLIVSAKASKNRIWAWLFAGTTFLSAFLLFLVQPMVGKLLLPIYGGAPTVWTTCLVFFQIALFSGYLWSHAGSAKIGVQLHTSLHVLVAVLACFSLPFALPSKAPPQGAAQLGVLLWLAVSVAPTFVILSTTAPLLQRWWSRLTKKEPYHLYAVSNAGSLMALVAYPLLVEPWFSVSDQTRSWAYVFGLVIVGICACAFRLQREPRASTESSAAVEAVGVSSGQKLLWLTLSAVPSVMLLAVTNHITIDVASGPLLWVVPLFLYLLSFVIVFGPLGGRARLIWLVLFLASLVALGINLFLAGQTTMFQQVLVSCVVLFSCSMLCHGELVRLRPSIGALTSFFLWMSAGGALGGILAGVIAPLCFKGFFELPFAVLATLVLLMLSFRAGPVLQSRNSFRLVYLGLGIGAPLMLSSVWLGTTEHVKDATVVSRKRGFFGSVQVTRFPQFTVLTHGRIRHGMQWNDPARQHEPTMYFASTTTVGKILRGLPRDRGHSIGVLGLGVGTLATYGRPGDDYWFFEIDPIVARAAAQSFSFLSHSAARIHVVEGDGREKLDEQRGPPFDVLVLDAFSSDAVPTHLLTTQAFDLYGRHLSERGILLANVSNRHLQIERVVAGAAQHLGWAFGVYETQTDSAHGVSRVRWAVLARNSVDLQRHLHEPTQPLAGPAVQWTDQSSSLLSILR
jgi:hypothetical protein